MGYTAAIRKALATCAVIGVMLMSGGCQDNRPAIVRAASLGQTDKVKSLLGPDVKVDQTYMEDSRTLLHYACKRGTPELVALLLEKGADFKIKDARGFTPFDLALNMDQGGPRLQMGQAACLVQLIKAGYPLDDSVDKDGSTFLHKMAAEVDSSALIEAILDTGKFTVDVRDKNGWTPLHVAAYHSRYDNCVALLAAKADVNAETTVRVGHKWKRGSGEGVWDYLYDVGSRPLDVYRTVGRQKSISRLLEEHGGTKNPNIKNYRRR